MDGRAQPSQIAGFLVGLAMKGERPDEIVGLARTMRARATKLVAIVRAGVRHLRHRRRRRAHLQRVDRGGAGAGGVRRARREARQPQRVEPLRQRRPLRGARRERRGDAGRSSSAASTKPGIAFLFAQTFHPSMKHAAQTRRELGVRTAFNLLGPLTNPGGRARQLVGVPRPELTELVARRWRSSAPSAPGSCTAPTASTRSRRPATRRSRNAATARSIPSICIRPTSGLPKAAPEALRGGDADRQRRDRARRSRRRARARARDIVLLNAGASLLIAGQRRDDPRRDRDGGGGDRQRTGRRRCSKRS